MSLRSNPPPSADVLRKGRRAAGLTQADLAARAGVPVTMISAYERGRRDATIRTLDRMLSGAGLTVAPQLVPRGEPARDRDTDLTLLAQLRRSPTQRIVSVANLANLFRARG